MFLRVFATCVLLLTYSAFADGKGFAKKVISQLDANGFFEVEYVPPREFGDPKAPQPDMSDLPKVEGFVVGKHSLQPPPGFWTGLDVRAWKLYVRGNAEHHKWVETYLRRMWAKR